MMTHADSCEKYKGWCRALLLTHKKKLKIRISVSKNPDQGVGMCTLSWLFSICSGCDVPISLLSSSCL